MSGFMCSLLFQNIVWARLGTSYVLFVIDSMELSYSGTDEAGCGAFYIMIFSAVLFMV